MTDATFIESAAVNRNYIEWRSVWSGALVTAAVASVLNGFALAIGLGVSSASPTWRDTSLALVLLTGLYLIFSAIVAYGLGGYVTGRSLIGVGRTDDETDFRDGMNGFVSWGLATILTALLIIAASNLTTHSSTAPSANVAAGESLISFDLDRLFRTEQRVEGDMTYPRAEAARILLTANSHAGMQADDRDYLNRLVARRTGLSPADAARRVDVVAGDTYRDVNQARRSAVILSFMSAAALLIGAVTAWLAAAAAARHREGIAPSHLWRWEVRRRSPDQRRSV